MEPQKGKIFFGLTILYLFFIGGIIFWYYFQIKEEVTNIGNLAQVEFQEKEKSKVVIVALGDSLTKAANPSREFRGDQEDYSYATGTKIDSFAKLMETKGYEVEAYNLAVSGAKTKEALDDQVPKAKNYSPDYVLITVGGNDAMKGEDINEVKENLQKILESFPQSKKLWGNIPNLAEFRKAPYPECQEPLKEIEVINNVEQFVEIYIKVYNHSLAGIVTSNGGEVVDLFDLLDRNDVSEADCLHFSISGQKNAAKAFFEKR